MIEKCCETCNYFEGSNETCPFTSTERFPHKWDVLVNCCNRWEEKKEDKLDLLCTDITLRMSGEQYWNKRSRIVVDYFRRRIRNSLDKAAYLDRVSKEVKEVNEVWYEAFDWIL